MSLRFIFVISWVLPLLMLAWILYHEQITSSQPVVETNSRMRIRMCLEHVATTRANPGDDIAKKAVEDCVVAGYLSGEKAKIAID